MHFRTIDKAFEVKLRVAALQKKKERLQRMVEAESSSPELRLQARVDLERVRREIRTFNLEIIRSQTSP